MTIDGSFGLPGGGMRWWGRVFLGVVLAVAMAAGLAPRQVSAAEQPASPWLELELQRRDKETGKIVTTVEKVDPKKIGVVAIDTWNWHWCNTATQRCSAVDQRMNYALEGARKLGMTVILAPAHSVADWHAGTPQRERAAALPREPLSFHVYESGDPVDIPLPANGWCMCGPGIECQYDYGWSRITPALHLGENDYIVGGPGVTKEGTQRLYAVCQAHDLTHLIYVGFHTNMCIAGKSSGMLPMANSGLKLILARDITDAITKYVPGGHTPDDGTSQTIIHWEKHFCPTIHFGQVLKKAGLWDEDHLVDTVMIAPWGVRDRPHLFENSFLVTLTAPQISDCQIRYTRDASEPTVDSELFERPFSVADTTTLRTAAFKNGKRVSLVSEAYFVKLAAQPPMPDVPISDLEPIRAIVACYCDSYSNPGLGSVDPAQMDRSYSKGPLQLRRKRYEKGVGVHAPARLLYEVKPEYERFVGLAGVDESLLAKDSGRGLANYPSVVFRVYVDGELQAESPILRISQGPWRFNVAIPLGSKNISLCTMEAGDGNRLDLANWVNAGFVLRSNTLTPEQVAEEKELQALYPAYRDVDADYRHAGKEALEQWWDWKYGLRIHWGVYSMVGSNASWDMAYKGAQYKQDYNQLYRKFNPTEFDGDEWADLMVRGGMKYYMFTAKHHDGFAMWDTKTKVKKRVVYPGPGAADGAIEDCDLHYSIMETPFGRDIVKELVDATRRRGLGIGLYYSHWDWYDADFRWSGYDKTWFDGTFSPETDPEGWQRFLSRHRAQVLELMTNYGPIDLVGWDCMINHPLHESTQHPIWQKAWPSVKETVKMSRRLQPGALMRQRGIYDYGDYFTPEGVIPANPADRKEHHEQRPWQVIYPCGTPSYRPNDGYKGANWILHSLIDITAKGGVFQVGFGPMPNGKFDERVVQRILYVGDWLKVNGEAIYKTRPWKHYEEGADIRYTRSKDGAYVYAISLKWPGEALALKKIKALEGTQIYMLGVEEPLSWRQDAEQGLVIEIGEHLQDEANRPCKQAYAFRIKGAPLEEVAARPF